MTAPAGDVTLRVRPAHQADRQLLRSLLDAYLVELARYGAVDLAYPWFDAYFRPGEPRWPYLIIDAAGATGGFALVNAYPPAGIEAAFAMAEFAILPHARGQGLGRRAAAEIFRRHPGRWALSVMPGNHPAQHFWPRALAAAGVPFTIRAGMEHTAYSFDIA